MKRVAGRMLCRLRGHRLYVDPALGEFCNCRCGRTFEWHWGGWRPVPPRLIYHVSNREGLS